MRAAFPYVFSAAVIATLLWPVARGTDDYPLSNYPMFSKGRSRQMDIHRAVGVVGDDRVQLPPESVGGEVMQVVSTIGRAVRGGTAGKLCPDIAARVATLPGLSEVTAVELLTEQHDIVDYFAAEAPRPLSRKVRARCEVRR